MAKKSTTAKKAIRSNPKAFIITLIAVVVIIAIAIAVLYFAFPETWDEVMLFIASLTQEESTGPDFESLERGDGELMVHFIDVGQGDCILIQFPDGKDMVIDCANYNDSGTYESETFQYLDAYVLDMQLDYLMLTHTDGDHVYFMDELLARYQVDNIYMPNVLASHDDFKAQIDALDTSMFTDDDTISTITYAEFFIAALSEPNCNVVLNKDTNDSTNTIIIEEDTYRLVFYCPTEAFYEDTGLSVGEAKNAISPIGILEYNGRNIMFTGDSNEINEPLIIERTGAVDCDVLKVGHHGSETSTTTAFLNAYNFEYAIISCNASGNKFEHPRQDTLDRLKKDNITVYRTDNNGNIVLTIDAEGNIDFVLEKESTQQQNLIGADKA